MQQAQQAQEPAAPPVTVEDLRRRVEGLVKRKTRLTVEYGRVASFQLAQLADYDISPAEICECLGIAGPLRKGMTVEAMVQAALAPEPGEPQRCAVRGCGAPATRICSGKPVCDDDAHRPPEPIGGRRN